MIVEKIHRVLIEDADSKMMISILNFKDVLLYLLRIANESPVYICNRIAVKELLDSNQVNKPAIEEGEPLWKGFELLADVHRSLWITVVGPDNQFRGMLFREDFREIMKNWQLHYVSFLLFSFGCRSMSS